MNLNKNKKGFTIIELIVSMSIFIFITSIVLLNFHYGNFDTELRTNAQVFASYLRQAQNMAQSGVITKQDNESTSAYGIFIKSRTSYILFADLNGNNIYDEDKDRDIIVENFKFVNFGPDNENISIVFSPPKPKVCAVDLGLAKNPEENVDCDLVDNLTFVLTHQKTGKSKTVSLNPISGQISIE